MKRHTLPIILVMALLVSALAMTATAATNVEPNNASKYASETMSPLFAGGPDYVDTWCPACNENARFYETTKIMSSHEDLTSIASHWYISESLSHSGGYKIPAGKKLCLYLNGCDLTSSSVVFATYGTLNLIGNGTEIVAGSNYGNYNHIGTTFDLGGGTLNLFGGKYQRATSSSNAGPVIGYTGKATVNMYNGTTVTGHTNTKAGGSIGLYVAGSTLNIHGGTVQSGQAPQGGNIGVTAADCTVKISGGTVTGGKATDGGNIGVPSSVSGVAVNIDGGTVTLGATTSGNGGNISICGKSTLNVTSGEVSNGTSEKWGGNLYSDSYTNINITGGSFIGGSAVYGGSIGMEHSYLSFQGGSISGGVASANGGNLYLSSNATNYGRVTINNADGDSAPSISGGKAESGYGGNIYLNVASNKTVALDAISVATGKASRGGNLYLEGAGSVTTNGASFTDGEADYGGSIYLKNCSVNATDLTVTGGKATDMGGAVYVNAAKLTLTDSSVSNGQITGTGSYKWGGNFYVEGDGTGKVTVATGTTISGGKAPFGGNITVYDGSTLEITGGEISGGEAANYGGNIYMSKGTLTQTGGTVKNGTSTTDRGGNLYVSANASASVKNATYEGGNAKSGGSICSYDATFAMENTSVSGGVATTGGNFYFYAPATLTDCTMTAEEDAERTGEQFYNEPVAAITLDGCTLTGGSVYADGSVTAIDTAIAKLIIRQGALTLKGATDIAQLNMSQIKSGEDVTYATMSVDTSFSGTATVVGLANGAAKFGEKLAESYTATGDFSGKLIINTLSEKPLAFHDEGRLLVGNAYTVKGDVITWHKNNAAAVAAYGDSDRLIPAAGELCLAGSNYVVNVSGWELNVTGNGTVTFFDTANKNYVEYGTVTVNGPTVANTFATEVDGNTYYMINDNGKLSFHRLSVKVDAILIRPSASGIFYESTWRCDDLLKTKIKSFGVAVSLDDQPDEDFARDVKNLYTQFGPEEFESGVKKTSVLISNILKNGATNNDSRGKRPIFGTAYVVLDDGSDTGLSVIDGENHDLSLYDVMHLMDQDPDFYAANKDKLDPFYDAWKDIMSGWGFERIGKTSVE